MKAKKMKFAVLMRNGNYFRVSEITRHPNFCDDDWVVVAEKLEKNDFLSQDEIKNHQIVYSPQQCGE